ncbi:cell envelope integrity protein TolA [Sulfitobacter donghicola]|uniref:Cell envelope biogenesis protein TonB n=1 Tax=Sulfitobacter donghicola DSW-25 = KCTC 12864 = JCM 14565 TaxID=1300350 RepID=A0A073IFG9_9RHOB|nr:TonB family protein [Sulfitobacter donghicola]KEJ88489.1 cell envelope biogenesis protein TonB [Sulfitobacter donghicola DSW-25 = KCTC 12864 = JCM 14565]KIN69635.1 TonB family C-terminal domain protein [Sulfitobacter donghicola DSW-25 = KCTC 12864 = JCM 14565]
MIASSPTAKVISFVVATTFLVGAVTMAAPEMKVEIEGGGEQAAANFGTRFEDMAIGTLSAQPADTETPVPPQPITPPLDTAEVVQAETPTAAQSEAVQDTLLPEPALAATSIPITEATAAQPIQEALTVTAALTPTIQPSVPIATAPTPSPETVTSQAPASTAPPLSSRPKRRDPVKAAKVAAERPKPQVSKPKPSKQAAAKPRTKTTKQNKTTKQKTPRGNAKQNNKKGSATGTNKRASTKAQGRKKKASASAGNAAASNYPGQVMRRISRVRKPRVNSRGTAVVSFSISSSGGLSRVSIARSSGSAALDNAAKGVIRKAAPFPKPPRGAKRQFSIRIKGR